MWEDCSIRDGRPWVNCGMPQLARWGVAESGQAWVMIIAILAAASEASGESASSLKRWLDRQP